MVSRFHKAIKHQKYQPPQIQKNPFNQFLNQMAIKALNHYKNGEIKQWIRNQITNINLGWKIGVENPEELRMNHKDIPWEQHDLRTRIKLLVNICEGIEYGAMVTMNYFYPKRKEPVNIIALNPVDKETSKPVTWATEKIRVTRHGTFAPDWFEWSANEMTPDKNVWFKLPRLQVMCLQTVDIKKYYNIGYKVWIAKKDLDDAFRQLGLRRSEWLMVVYNVLNIYIMDTRDVYGLRAASRHCQELGHFVILIFMLWVKPKLVKFEAIKIKHYIDDYGIWIRAKTLRRAKEILVYFETFVAKAGIKESIRKREGPGDDIKLCGWKYNVENTKVTVVKEKRDKTKNDLILAFITGRDTLKRYESTTGRCYHFAEAIWPAKAFCRRQTERIMLHKRIYGERNILMNMRNDARDQWWWIKYIDIFKSASMFKIIRCKNEGIPLWCDGATGKTYKMSSKYSKNDVRFKPGLGGYFKGHWFIMDMSNFEKYAAEYTMATGKLKIAHYEALALAVSLSTFQKYMKIGMKLNIRCDSRHVVGNVADKSSSDNLIMEVIRFMTMFAVQNRVEWFITEIGTLDNKLPDTLSRFDIVGFKRVCKKWQMPCDKHRTPVIMPKVKEW